jgi:hypothetical protein
MSDLEHPSQSEPQENENWQHRFVDTPELNVSLSPESETHTDDFHRQTVSIHSEVEKSDVASATEQNLRKLLQDVERMRQASPQAHPTESRTEVTYLDRFIDRARDRFEQQDIKGALEVLQEALKMAPENPEVVAMIDKTRRAFQIQQAESELARQIEETRAQAIKLFEQGNYRECIAGFNVLYKLDPTNIDLRDYLEIS